MKNYYPCKKLNNYNGPLLIVHGDQDSKVAYQDVINCYESLNNPNKRIEIIKGSEHGFHSEPYETQVTEMILEFFRSKL